MAGIDKILVVIVLIFSVVFVVAAINGYSKIQDEQCRRRTRRMAEAVEKQMEREQATQREARTQLVMRDDRKAEQ